MPRSASTWTRPLAYVFATPASSMTGRSLRHSQRGTSSPALEPVEDLHAVARDDADLDLPAFERRGCSRGRTRSTRTSPPSKTSAVSGTTSASSTTSVTMSASADMRGRRSVRVGVGHQHLDLEVGDVLLALAERLDLAHLRRRRCGPGYASVRIRAGWPTATCAISFSSTRPFRCSGSGSAMTRSSVPPVTAVTDDDGVALLRSARRGSSRPSARGRACS